MHYLDNVATTAVSRACADVAYNVMINQFGNPSSLHSVGIDAEHILTKSRKQVAQAIGADAKNIYFTSGGTESDNLAIFSAVRRMAKRGKHIITTDVEHPAVLNPIKALASEGFRVTYLPADRNGLVDIADVEKALTDDTILVSIMLVNNETGAIMPVGGIKKLLVSKNSQALLHTDAVQGLGKVPVNVNSLGVDLLSVSGHKIHAPKGVGALYVRSGLTLPPLLYGGGQESGLRSGTENLPGIAAFGEACEVVSNNLSQIRRHVHELSAYLYKCISEELPEVQLNFTMDSQRVANIMSISLPGAKSEVMMRILEGYNVYVSSGSACAKGKKSYVLAACGLSDNVIDGTLRVSFSDTNTVADIDALVEGLKMCRQRLINTTI